MTFSASCIYHRGYRKGDIIDIFLKNKRVYHNCVYSHISKHGDNVVLFIHNNDVLPVFRHEIDDIYIIKKSPFRKRNLYRQHMPPFK